jgi:hypothetical protein
MFVPCCVERFYDKVSRLIVQECPQQVLAACKAAQALQAASVIMQLRFLNILILTTE